MTEQQTRYIWLIRHAKSADAKIAQVDFDRSLNKRGNRDGHHMQIWLSQQAHPASWVWSSPAARAKLTAEFVSSAFNATFVEDRRLYLASAEMLMEVLKSTPEDVSSVAIVAHNPGLTHLVNSLGQAHVTDNLVTFGTALFRTQQSWRELQLGQSQLITLQTPRSL